MKVNPIRIEKLIGVPITLVWRGTECVGAVHRHATLPYSWRDHPDYHLIYVPSLTGQAEPTAEFLTEDEAVEWIDDKSR